MASATVNWFNPTKGYGFIQPQGGGKDVFVHISAVERAGLTSLNEGKTVQYEIESNCVKDSAVNLKVSNREAILGPRIILSVRRPPSYWSSPAPTAEQSRCYT